MRVTLQVHSAAEAHEFANVDIHLDGGGVRTQLDVEYTPVLDRCGTPDPIVTDLLLVAAGVYATDKLVARSGTQDRWTRDLAVMFPVSDAARWEQARASLTRCLRFLTGDRWDVAFTDLPGPLARPSKGRAGCTDGRASADAVCLYSGGLDSLIGAIDWLETEPGRLLLVGHHDRNVRGPFKDQRALAQPLNETYPGRTDTMLAQVGMKGRGAEITYRSRSLLFLALGIQAAAAVGPGTPVLIPENGTIALNLPLTPARRGTCSTRTAHPHYLSLLDEWLAHLGLAHPIRNSLFGKTKGECVSGCRNHALLERVYATSVSCAKRGHRASWVRRDATHCGRCMPCIYRRAALHTMGWDTERYGSDICTGEVAIDAAGGRTSVASNDLRAVLACLRAKPTEREIATHLLANGRLAPDMLPDAAATVGRTLEEIRRLLRDKGIPEIQRRAGLAAEAAV